jgi:hypothetical protein
MPTAVARPRELVDAFAAVLAAKNADGLGTLFTEDADRGTVPQQVLPSPAC